MKICLWSLYFKIKSNLWKSLSLPLWSRAVALSALSEQELPFFPNSSLPEMSLLILTVLHWTERYQTCILMMNVGNCIQKMRIFFGVPGACESSSVPGERSEPVSFRHWVHALHRHHHGQGERAWMSSKNIHGEFWSIQTLNVHVCSHTSDLEICACLLFNIAL